MKKLLTATILASALALTLGISACSAGGKAPSGGKFDDLTTAESVYGFSAASAGMLISAMDGGKASASVKSFASSAAENAPEGFRYARVYRDGVADGTAVWGGKFGISANYMGNMNFNLYPAGAYIAFDYKATWNGSNMWVVPRLVSSVSNAYANIRNLTLPCDNAWHTVCIPLSFAPQKKPVHTGA